MPMTLRSREPSADKYAARQSTLANAKRPVVRLTLKPRAAPAKRPVVRFTLKPRAAPTKRPARRAPAAQANARRAPAAQLRSRGSVADYRVFVMEGPRVFSNPPCRGQWTQCTSMCGRSNGSVNDKYIKDEFDIQEEVGKRRGDPSAAFCMWMQDPFGKVVAFARCTLKARLAGMGGPARRIVFVDIVCSDVAHKGAGTVLIQEVEGYARDAVGAHAVALHSVTTPTTVRQYLKKNYRRGVVERSPGSRAEAMARYAKLLSGSKQDLLECTDASCYRRAREMREFLRGKTSEAIARSISALNGEYYPHHNRSNVIAMFKPLEASRTPTPGRSPIQWTSDFGRFQDPKTRLVREFVAVGKDRFIVPMEESW